MSQKILFVFTSNDKLVNTDKKTGWYLPEAAHPYYVLKEAGFELVAASEKGGKKKSFDDRPDFPLLIAKTLLSTQEDLL